MFRRAPRRSTHRVRPVLTLCTAGAAVLKSTPVLASDPAGTLSGLYAFLFVVPWVVLNLVLTVVIAIKGGYRSAASTKLHAAVGASVPLLGLGVNIFDYFVVRRPSTPWPGVETILISGGLCTLGLAACLLAPLLVHRNTKGRSD
jgi:hypothetical protein